MNYVHGRLNQVKAAIETVVKGIQVGVCVLIQSQRRVPPVGACFQVAEYRADPAEIS